MDYRKLTTRQQNLIRFGKLCRRACSRSEPMTAIMRLWNYADNCDNGDTFFAILYHHVQTARYREYLRSEGWSKKDVDRMN